MGILFIIGGVHVIQTPQESYINLAWFFSALVLANGIATIYFSFSNKLFIDGWGWYFAGGLFEIIFGIVLLKHPDISIVMLPLFLGFWMLFKGMQMMGTAYDLKSLRVLDWGWVMIFGIFVFIIAFFMLLNPLFAFFNVIYFTVLGLFFMGIGNIVIAFKLKKFKKRTIDKVEEFKADVKKHLTALIEDIKVRIKDEKVHKSIREPLKKIIDELK